MADITRCQVLNDVAADLTDRVLFNVQLHDLCYAEIVGVLEVIKHELRDKFIEP